MAKDFNCSVDVVVIPMFDYMTVDMIRDYWERLGIGLEIWKPHNWAGGRKYRQVQKRLKSCGRPFNGPVQILADGRQILCCYDYDAKMVLGDTKKNSVAEILGGSLLTMYRRKHEDGDLKGLPCESCDQLNVYSDDDSPLLYSSIDPNMELGKQSSNKMNLEVVK